MAEVHGRRLLPSTIDKIAQDNPCRVWASVQLKGQSEFDDITIAAFANAINRTAHWIVNKVGAQSSKSEKSVVAYIGPSDLRYYVLFMAIVKAGYVPLFISHQNSAAANASVFDAVGCNILLCGLDDLDQVHIDAQNIRVLYLPSYEETWDAMSTPAFPFIETFDDMIYEPLLIMHTSGSTGMPKPITYTHGWFAAADSSQDIPDFKGHESEPRARRLRSRHFLGFPPFHPAGLSSGLRDSVYFGITIVFPRADRPIDAASVINVIDHGHVDGAALLPHVLEEVARDSEALKRVHRLRYIDWVGGPISQEAGDLISAHTTLNNSYASTELGSSSQLHKTDRSLWQWYFFNPRVNGFDFRPVAGEKNLFELFVVKNPTLEQPVFRIFPHLNEWPMGDLFVPHPTLPHYWRLEGRSDDLIIFQNGSKINPRAVEDAVKRAPKVKESLMFGAGRTRAGILLEPVEPDILDKNSIARDEFLNDVFLFVEESNRVVPENGIVIRDLLALTRSDKPLPRTAKGTLQRKAALALYEGEIDALYRALPLHKQKIRDFRIGSQAT